MQYSDPLTLDKVADPKATWLPLVIHSALANSVEDISANIESAISGGHTSFNELIGAKSGAVAIVGSGPSLKENWQQLRSFEGDIIACNAACQFLLGKGITPKYMMCFDADNLALEFFTPHPDITYLLASRCPPKAFEILKGCSIVCWHAAGDERMEELLQKNNLMNEPMVLGGSAAVVRAMILAMPMGYKKIHIYGADSSFAKGDTHIRKSTTTERIMAILCAGRVFETAPWMAKQAEDFKALIKTMSVLTDIEFIVHGDGLIPHIAMMMGLKTDLENSFSRFLREWRSKARTLWQYV